MTNRETMTNHEKIELAERALKTLKDAVKTQEAKLSDLKKQAEPKEGEWWYFVNSISFQKGVILISKRVNEPMRRTPYREMYLNDEAIFNSNCSSECLQRPATTEEITYFMGLHAERLGIKEGVTKINRSNLKHPNEKPFNKENLDFSFDKIYFDGDYLWCGGAVIRDSFGNWATVVTEKPKNGKLKAKITELKERIQKAKDILDGK